MKTGGRGDSTRATSSVDGTSPSGARERAQPRTEKGGVTQYKSSAAATKWLERWAWGEGVLREAEQRTTPRPAAKSLQAN